MPVLAKRVLEDIRARNEIVDVIGAVVRLVKAGGAHKGLCPFHQEKTPSFHVNPARQIFHCFGCGAGGDVFAFVMKREGLDFMGAVRSLAARAGVRLEFEGAGDSPDRAERERLYALHQELAREYHRILLEDPRADGARNYLKSRDLGDAVIRDFLIGYAPAGWDFVTGWARRQGVPTDLLVTAGLAVLSERPGARGEPHHYDRFRDRIMFPVCDEQARVVAFSGRIMKPDEKAAKYVNSPETPIFRKSRLLFALHKARVAIVESRTALVCEGQIDTIRCHAAGFTNAVASQGTAFTEEHARILRRFADRVTLVFDPDTAGRNAAVKTGLIFAEAGLDVRVARLPEGQDPDLFIRENGAAAFGKVLEEARPGLDFLVETAGAKEDLGTGSGMRRVEEAAFEWMARVPGMAERGLLAQRLAELLGVNPLAVRGDFEAFDARRRRQSGPGPAPAPDGPVPPADGAPAETPEEPPPPEERMLLEHVAADIGMAMLLEEYAPPEVFRHPLCARLAGRMIEARRAGGDWASALREGGERDERLLALAAAIQLAPSKAGAVEYSRTDAVQSLILRVWSQRLKAEKAETQRRMPAGDERNAILFRYTTDMNALKDWTHGQSVMEERLAELRGAA